MPASAAATTAPAPRLGRPRTAAPASVPQDMQFTQTDNRDYEEAKSWFEGMVKHATGFNEPIAIPQPKRVTPGLARVLLEHNSGNRNIARNRVEDYKNDLKDNRWKLNGESVKVAKDGSINDAQHRALAILESGRNALMFFVFGLDRESRMTLDQGVSRTAAGNLQMINVEDAATMSTVASFVLMARETGRLTRSSRGRPTRGAVQDFVLHYEQQLRSAIQFVQETIGRKGSLRNIATPALLAFSYFMLREKAGEARAQTFMRELLTGAKENGKAVVPGDAVYTLRERLADLSKQGAFSGDKAHLIFRAWNQWIRGGKVRHIRLNRGDTLPAIEAP
jgi:hypothetical protein